MPPPSRGSQNSATDARGDATAPRPERSPATTAEVWTVLARVVRPHGRRGEVVAEVLTDFPERFHERKRLYLLSSDRASVRRREVQVENFWFLRSRIVLKFQGIDSINEADLLRGYEVAIPATERAPLEEGAFYVSDLVGCRVYDLNQGSLEVGEIMDVDRGSSSTELLVVRRANVRGAGADALIPFVREYLVRIDAAARRVEMRLPPGLLEINEPLTDEEKREMNGQR